MRSSLLNSSYCFPSFLLPEKGIVIEPVITKHISSRDDATSPNETIYYHKQRISITCFLLNTFHFITYPKRASQPCIRYFYFSENSFLTNMHCKHTFSLKCNNTQSHTYLLLCDKRFAKAFIVSPSVSLLRTNLELQTYSGIVNTLSQKVPKPFKYSSCKHIQFETDFYLKDIKSDPSIIQRNNQTQQCNRQINIISQLIIHYRLVSLLNFTIPDNPYSFITLFVQNVSSNSLNQMLKKSKHFVYTPSLQIPHKKRPFVLQTCNFKTQGLMIIQSANEQQRRNFIASTSIFFTKTHNYLQVLDSQILSYYRQPESGRTQCQFWEMLYLREAELVVRPVYPFFLPSPKIDSTMSYESNKKFIINQPSTLSTDFLINDYIRYSQLSPIPYEIRQDLILWIKKIIIKMNWKKSTFYIAVHALDSYLLSQSRQFSKLRHQCYHFNNRVSLEVNTSYNQTTQRQYLLYGSINQLRLITAAALFLAVCTEEEHTEATRARLFINNIASVTQLFIQQLHMLTFLNSGLLITKTPEDFLYYFLANMKLSSRFNYLYKRMLISNNIWLSLDVVIQLVLIGASLMYDKGGYTVLPASRLIAACLIPILTIGCCPELSTDIYLLYDFCNDVFKFNHPSALYAAIRFCLPILCWYIQDTFLHQMVTSHSTHMVKLQLLYNIIINYSYPTHYPFKSFVTIATLNYKHLRKTTTHRPPSFTLPTRCFN